MIQSVRQCVSVKLRANESEDIFVLVLFFFLDLKRIGCDAGFSFKMKFSLKKQFLFIDYYIHILNI